MSKHNQDTINSIIKLDAEGLSSRKICKGLGWAESRKSTVTAILQRERENQEDIEIIDEICKKEEEGLLGWYLEEDQLEALCSSEDWDIRDLAKKLRTAQRANTHIRKVNRTILDNEEDAVDFEYLLDVMKSKLNPEDIRKTITLEPIFKEKTVEILFSDWQFGKISESWNTEIAIKAAEYYGQELVKAIEEVSPERIVFSALGDNIEDALKHGVQSAKSTDTSNAEQIANCTQVIWYKVLEPIMAMCIPMDFVGVAGNHGSSEHKGMDMFKAGRYCSDYVLYKAWEMLSIVAGYDHVTFNLPEGHFATYEIYGKLTVAEHGYSCKGSSETAMLALRTKRSNNLQEYVHRLVVGDMHHYCNYDNGNMQINGAAFGVAFDAIEFSGIMGFHAVPCQILNVHEPVNGVGQNTVVETKVIQIAKGY